MSYFFQISDIPSLEQAQKKLVELGFSVPDILAPNVFYIAAEGQVYGIANADSKRYKPLVDFIKRHQQIKELTMDEEPQKVLNVGDVVVWNDCLGKVTAMDGFKVRIGTNWVKRSEVKKADHRDEIRILKR